MFLQDGTSDSSKWQWPVTLLVNLASVIVAALSVMRNQKNQRAALEKEQAERHEQNQKRLSSIETSVAVMGANLAYIKRWFDKNILGGSGGGALDSDR